MKREVFLDEEVKEIKENMQEIADDEGFLFDVEKVYDEFEFMVSQMNKNIKIRFSNNLDNICRDGKVDRYEHLAELAVKLKVWLSHNYIVEVTKFGNFRFLARFPSKNDKYEDLAHGIKVWTKANLKKALEEESKLEVEQGENAL